MIHERIRLGISACLLGEPVRFDGGHKRDQFLVESLGQFVDWVPVCPEVESGLDAPRESMRLVQTDGRIRLLTNKRAQDHTTRMDGYARRRVEELADDTLVGFVLKKDSPTCGLERVKVYGTAGMPVKSGRGLFAHALVTRFPLLPVEEEGRLNDPRLRENFVERIFAYRRLTALFATRWSMGTVVRFHTAHKLTLMAHMPEAYQRLGRLGAATFVTGCLHGRLGHEQVDLDELLLDRVEVVRQPDRERDRFGWRGGLGLGHQSSGIRIQPWRMA